MTTALDIINGSLRLLQVASPDVVLTSDEANDALEALNQMIDSWSNESLMLHHLTLETFTLIPGHNPHTIGTGGDLNTTRPADIDSASVSVGGIDYPVNIIGYDDYSVIRLKSINSVYPEYLYLDQNYPLANVYLYPVPSTASTLKLYTRKLLTKFVHITDLVNLPAGYNRALKYSLALELASEYQTTAGQDVILIAQSSKAILKRVNHRPVTMQIDPALLANRGSGRFNIYRGD